MRAGSQIDPRLRTVNRTTIDLLLGTVNRTTIDVLLETVHRALIEALLGVVEVFCADAIQVGTRFLSAEECNAHEVYKEKILKATDISTIVTGKSFGHPVRSLKTPFSKTFARMENDPSVKPEDILSFGAGGQR